MELPEPYPVAVYMDTPAGVIYVEAPDTDRYLRAYDRVWQETHGADESAALLSAAAEETQ